MVHSCPLWTGIPTPLVLGVGVECTKDMTCYFCVNLCVNWSPAQWELFAKKRSYKEHKKSCPSGSVPPAAEVVTCMLTPSGVSQPGTSSSSLSRPSGGQEERGGLGVHLVLCLVRLLPLPLDLGLARGGGGICLLHSSVARATTSVSSAPSGAARSQLTPLAHTVSSVASLHSSPHARRRGEFESGFRGPFQRCILSWFPIFGSRSTEE